MSDYVIEGGKKFFGEVAIGSAKNALLSILAASVLVDGMCYIENVPQYTDVLVMLEIIKAFGGRVTFYGNGVSVDTTNICNACLPPEMFSKIRASIFMVGALVARTGKAVARIPGGCKIGPRPIDIHIEGLKQFGIKVVQQEDSIEFYANNLHGAQINMSYPSVGATVNLMITACLADGRTIIRNCAKEPEICDTAKFLISCGAKITGAGTDCIVIDGVKKLKGCKFLPICDRIEGATFAIATILNGGEINIKGSRIQNILPIINNVANNACKIYSFNDKIYINSSGVRPRACKVTARPHPGFPTDAQPIVAALLSLADGESLIVDEVFPQRFSYAEELNKLGAKIQVRSNRAYVNGVNKLRGGVVMAEDLRGGAGLVVACLRAEGESRVCNVEHIERGYFDLDKKLRMLGQSIIKS